MFLQICRIGAELFFPMAWHLLLWPILVRESLQRFVSLPHLRATLSYTFSTQMGPGVFFAVPMCITPERLQNDFINPKGIAKLHAICLH